jgi:hypothetical protein
MQMRASFMRYIDEHVPRFFSAVAFLLILFLKHSDRALYSPISVTIQLCIACIEEKGRNVVMRIAGRQA